MNKEDFIMNLDDKLGSLLSKAKVSQHATLLDMVNRYQCIFFKRLTSKGVPYDAFIDLRLMSAEHAEFFLKWLALTYKERIDKGQPIILAYEVIKECPVWARTVMPYKNVRRK